MVLKPLGYGDGKVDRASPEGLLTEYADLDSYQAHPGELFHHQDDVQVS